MGVAPRPAGLDHGARSTLRTAIALAATIAAALVLVDAQPIRSAWWIYDGADPSYAAAGLELMSGQPVKFLDHPGLPLTELTALSFGADYALGRAKGDGSTRREYADRQMLDLNRARPVYRTLAILLYVAGALAAFIIVARLFRHWAWGLAGAVMWFAAPGLAPLSIQMRPDVPLAALVLLFALLVRRAADTRAPGPYLLAACVAGFGLMLKLHAVGLLVPLTLLLLIRPPEAGWPAALRSSTARTIRRRSLTLAVTAAAMLALAIAFNFERLPFTPTHEQVLYARLPILVVATYLLVATLAGLTLESPLVRRVLDPFYGVAGAAFLAGLALPAVLALPEGLQAMVNIGKGLSGGGVNEGVKPFSVPFSRLFEQDLKVALIVFLLAGVAAVWGLATRDPVPAIWFSGALALGIMAQARLGSLHYFIPAFMLSIPGALWLVRRGARGRPPILVWALLLLLVYPTFRDRYGTRDEVERLARVAAPSLSAISQRLRQGQVAFTPSGWPVRDSRYFELVQRYVFQTPDYPYRFLPAAPDAAQLAEKRGLDFRYFMGPAVANVAGTQRIAIAGLGEYTVRRLTDAEFMVELLEGPGADTPYDHPEARYDPRTGYFKDQAGLYWNRKGEQIVSPPSRRYIPKLGLWLDAYGDFWDARGNLVMSNPKLRTAP